MTNIIKLLKLPVLLGVIIGSGFIFSACNRYGVPVKKENKWVNWQIEFKENTTEEQKRETFYAIQNSIYHYCDSLNTTVYYIRFTSNRIPNRPNIRGFQVDASLSIKSTGATKSPSPPPPSPIHPGGLVLPERIWRNINIIDQNIGGNIKSR